MFLKSGWVFKMLGLMVYWVEMEDKMVRMVEEDERVRIERLFLLKKDE